MREIAETDGIPLEPEKEETIVFRRKGRKAEKVKWLGIILDSELQFQEHLIESVKRARQMLGNLNKSRQQLLGLEPNELEVGIHRHDQGDCAVEDRS